MVAGLGSEPNGDPNCVGEVDMRSDTVTKPTEDMRQAMAGAVVGDDVFGDDPTVKQLEAKVAELLGKEAGLFVTSGTMGNLIAVGVHCPGKGQEVICGKESHTFFYEQGGASSLMGAILNTVPNQPDGTLVLDDIRKCIKPADNHHFAESKLLILENTQNKMGGKVLPLDYMKQAGALCSELKLKLHIDGARLWNAAAKLGVAPSEITAPADTATVCLSKALGAPVGSVLVGPADFITKARRLRKALGGGMRQAGVLAAAGIFALDHHLSGLKMDHTRAKRLADGLTELGLEVIAPDTNMVFFDVDEAPAVMEALAKRGVHMLCLDGKRRCRAVCHLQVDDAGVEKAIDGISAILSERPAKRPRMA